MLSGLGQETGMIEFVWPWALALLPLPLLIYFFLPPANHQEAALRVPFFDQLKTMSETGTSAHKSISGHKTGYMLLLILLWLAVVAATCRPQWVGEPIELPVSGRDLMLAVDISGSMKVEDLELGGHPVTRLEVVKEVLGDFIERRRGDRIGLLLFGTQAYLQAPLTFDRNAVHTLLDESQIGFAGEKTAIGNAIGMAVKRLKNRPENSRLLVLLTDGANTSGEVTPLKATEIAQKQGIRIHTIGVGAREMVTRGILGARRVNPSADLDEELLKQIALQTGGRYFRAHNSAELDEIYILLDKIEPVSQEAESFRPVKSLYFWPLGLALMLALIIGTLRFNLWSVLRPARTGVLTGEDNA